VAVIAKIFVMKQISGSCAVINMETLTYDDGTLLLARNTSYSMKCLARIFQVCCVHGVHGIHIQ
jgi:hypothetical protein